MGVFHFNAGRYREALPFYEMALQRKPGHPEAYFNMGSAFMNMSQMDSAEWAFRKALEQNPKLMESYISLGNIASGRGDTKGQIENYKNAAALGHQGAMGWLQQRNISWN
jgi:tetratricopeptide (TPR) repeat protein